MSPKQSTMHSTTITDRYKNAATLKAELDQLTAEITLAEEKAKSVENRSFNKIWDGFLKVHDTLLNAKKNLEDLRATLLQKDKETAQAIKTVEDRYADFLDASAALIEYVETLKMEGFRDQFRDMLAGHMAMKHPNSQSCV
ncbi:Protein of unknown function [Pyronema omphalodes CBS 100304]|uniref:Uncharacterized protein n=1 Tax=Pyronema omphalodes (strain CBS 100304) TaxID=1076935 RepID=U4LBE5_PYROM|nr:Protein of unknown function [Pyronema omphalodes CBS 100304]